MAELRIGLALGGGAARGWAHIGIIEALLDAGIEPNIVAGTSMGALVGAAYAAGRLAELRQWAEAADWRVVAGMIDIQISNGGLVDGKRIQGWLRESGLDIAIETLPMRYAAVATDLIDGREIWLQEGALDEAIRASIALPGIFSPYQINGRWLIDGGLVNQVPVSTCRALGSEFTIAVSLNEGLLGRRLDPQPAAPLSSPPARKRLADLLEQMTGPLQGQLARIVPGLLQGGPKNPAYFDVLTNSINIMQDKITRSRLAGEPPHALLRPNLSQIGLMEFHRAAEVIELGRSHAKEAIPAIRASMH
ncbi:MAG: patatin-like phospholipase family protein [Devosia sp.]|nr:patatin-like phospholipase family protein [Devosia sp.]